jgi:urease accessory protein
MKTLRRSSYSRALIAVSALALLAPVAASAHPGFPGHTHGFINGFMHPLTGLDHLVGMIAVGLWAAQQGGKAIWQVPLLFLSAMALGGMVGLFGLGELSITDQAIAATVLVTGILIATATRMSLRTGAFAVASFALFHGYAHGAEMPATASGLLYAAGFILATAILQSTGISVGLTARAKNSMGMVRAAGYAVAVCGIYLLLAR